MAIRHVMHRLPYGPSAGTIFRIDLLLTQPCDSIAHSLWQIANGGDPFRTRGRRQLKIAVEFTYRVSQIFRHRFAYELRLQAAPPLILFLAKIVLKPSKLLQE